jgi:hypothetical protein
MTHVSVTSNVSSRLFSLVPTSFYVCTDGRHSSVSLSPLLCDFTFVIKFQWFLKYSVPDFKCSREVFYSRLCGPPSSNGLAEGPCSPTCAGGIVQACSGPLRSTSTHSSVVCVAPSSRWQTQPRKRT